MITIITSNHFAHTGRLIMKSESWLGRSYKRVGSLCLDDDWAWFSSFDCEVVVYSPIVWGCFHDNL